MKKGDKVLVFGGVWRNFESVKADVDLFYFLDGRKAKIVNVVNNDEFTVTFYKDKGSMRHPYGYFEVHPKQCRKVKP